MITTENLYSKDCHKRSNSDDLDDKNDHSSSSCNGTKIKGKISDESVNGNSDRTSISNIDGNDIKISNEVDTDSDTDNEIDFESLFKEKNQEDTVFYFKRIDRIYDKYIDNKDEENTNYNGDNGNSNNDNYNIDNNDNYNNNSNSNNTSISNDENNESKRTTKNSNCEVNFIFNYNNTLELSCKTIVDTSNIDEVILNRLLIAIGLCSLPWYWMGFGSKRIVVDENVSYSLLGCSVISVSDIICILILLLMHFAGLYFSVGLDLVTPFVVIFFK
jgi:hypothetical protein